MGVIASAIGIAGFIWGLHAFGIISLTPELLPGVLAQGTRNIARPADRIGTKPDFQLPIAQDVFNTIFGARRSIASRTEAGSRAIMSQSIGGPGSNLSQGHGGGL